MRALLFLLVVLFAILANTRSDAVRYTPDSDSELYWQRDSASQSAEDDIHKRTK